jgi:hypothetical protein
MDARRMSIFATGAAVAALCLPVFAADPRPSGTPTPMPEGILMTNPMMDVSDPLGTGRPQRVVSDQCKGFDGTWADNWGTTISMLSGKGQYVFQGIQATLVGKVEGQKFTGIYLQPNYPDPIFQKGKVEFELTADGKGWKGKSWDKDGKNEMPWDADCVGAYAPPTPTPAPLTPDPTAPPAAK